jgi:hypothetical protein
MQGITGDIPLEFGLMSNLFSLNLKNLPDLGGTLPNTLGTMASLHTMVITNTGLMGTIPTEIGQLTLGNFVFEDNPWFEGTIPVEIGMGWENITQFVLRNCRNLHGTIPDISGWNATVFALGGSRGFHGPIPDFSGWTALRVFELFGVNITGEISVPFDGFASLKYVSIRDNPGITGNISAITVYDVNEGPEDLSGPYRCEISLMNCPLLGGIGALTGGTANCHVNVSGIPSIQGGLDALDMHQFDYVSITRMSGIVATLSPFPLHMRSSAKYLEIGDCPGITGGIPASDFHGYDFRTVSLYDTGLSGSVPQELAGLPITTLNLSGNHLTGTISTAILLVSQLQYLDISRNSITGSPFIALSLLTHLRYLNISRNSFPSLDLIDYSCMDYEHKVVLDVSHNQFYFSTTPPFIGDCVKEFHGSHNLFGQVIDMDFLNLFNHASLLDFSYTSVDIIFPNVVNATALCYDDLVLRTGNAIQCPMGNYGGLAARTDYIANTCNGCATMQCPPGGICRQIVMRPPVCTGNMCEKKKKK